MITKISKRVLFFAGLILIISFSACRNRDNKMIAKGNIEFGKKNFEEAIVYYKKALDINPNSWEAYYDIALCKGKLGNDTGAINAYTSAAKINPNDNVNIYINRGNHYITIKDYQGAIADFKKAIELNPSNEELYISMGASYRSFGNAEEAIKSFSQAIKVNPKSIAAFSERGYTYLVSKKYQEAINDFNEGLTIYNKDAIMLNNRAFSKFNLKDFDGAFEDINNSISLDPKSSYAYKVRGEIFLEKKDKLSACNDFNKALELGYTKNFGNDIQDLIRDNCK